jgi:Sec-independent protein translocase protein TatA
MLKIIFYTFIFWLLYKLIFDFIVPVYQSTKQVRRQMGDIQDRMRQQFEQQQQAAEPQRPQAAANAKKADKSDYLDFEEIK